MVDLTPFTQPKSDQLNADDLIGRTLTIKITRVTGQAGDQPVSIFFEGDNGKPYKPCKSMIRVLRHLWSSNGAEFVGRSLTLYRDEKVKFGGLAVGGIRISHMSHINGQQTMALTESKAKRSPYVVKPLATAPEDYALMALKKNGDDASANGVAAYTGWLGTLQPAEKERVRQFHQTWSQRAKAFDEPRPDHSAPAASSSPPVPQNEPESTIPEDAFPGDIPAGMTTEEYYNQQAGK